MFLLLAITHLIYFSFHLRLMIDDGRFAGLCEELSDYDDDDDDDDDDELDETCYSYLNLCTQL